MYQTFLLDFENYELESQNVWF